MSTVAEPIAPGRVAELIAKEEEAFRAKRKRSDQLWKQARQFIPRGVPSSFQDAAPQPVFADRGKGSRIWDVDGNEYVDFHNGFGVMVVGHAHPLIVDAISKRAARGTHFAQPVANCGCTASGVHPQLAAPRLKRSLSSRITTA